METFVRSENRPWWLDYVPIAMGNVIAKAASKLAGWFEELGYRMLRCEDCGALVQYEEVAPTADTVCGRLALDRMAKSAAWEKANGSR
jgi:hypothetical protein